jgi:outer membrane protein assembly factor BamB
MSENISIKHAKDLKLPTGILALDLSADAKTAYVSCFDGGVYAVALENGERHELGKHDSFASGVALLANSPLVVSAGFDGALHWHDTTERKTIRKIAAHNFWSWQLASNCGAGFQPASEPLIASVTGQYICGGYKYEPLPEREPSVRVYDAKTGELRHSFSHVPPVQSVAFSSDGKFLAAGNLMGEVRVWELSTGKQIANWTTPSFTGWGIIKGHYYTGGIFALHFAEKDEHLVLAGMGSTTDPAAGNGKQLWQRYSWRDGKKLGETTDGDSGKGLMETLAFHPGGKTFVMGGRLENGKWTLSLFDAKTGSAIQSIDTKSRVTKALFTRDGSKLILGETLGQAKPDKDKIPDWGRISIYTVESA